MFWMKTNPQIFLMTKYPYKKGLREKKKRYLRVAVHVHGYREANIDLARARDLAQVFVLHPRVVLHTLLQAPANGLPSRDRHCHFCNLLQPTAACRWWLWLLAQSKLHARRCLPINHIAWEDCFRYMGMEKEKGEKEKEREAQILHGFLLLFLLRTLRKSLVVLLLSLFFLLVCLMRVGVLCMQGNK